MHGFEMPNCVVDHLRHAPACVIAAKQPAQPARTALGQVIVDEDTQGGTLSLWRNVKTHSVGSNHEQLGLAGRFPHLALGRDSFSHDLFDREPQPKDAPAELQPGAHAAPARCVTLDLHPAPTEFPGGLAHVSSQASVIVQVLKDGGYLGFDRLCELVMPRQRTHSINSAWRRCYQSNSGPTHTQ